jgi:hypothetical protein
MIYGFRVIRPQHDSHPLCEFSVSRTILLSHDYGIFELSQLSFHTNRHCCLISVRSSISRYGRSEVLKKIRYFGRYSTVVSVSDDTRHWIDSLQTTLHYSLSRIHSCAHPRTIAQPRQRTIREARYPSLSRSQKRKKRDRNSTFTKRSKHRSELDGELGDFETTPGQQCGTVPTVRAWLTVNATVPMAELDDTSNQRGYYFLTP